MRGLLIGLLFSASTALADPESHYMIHCMGCHLADGRGMPPDVPVFDDQLGRIVSTQAGRAYLVRVPGAAQSLISDDDLAQVLNWILQKYSQDSLPENFKPYAADEVADYRQNILPDPVKYRSTLSGIDS